VVLHDAVAAFDGPVVELHISNPPPRAVPSHLVLAPVASGVVAGFGDSATSSPSTPSPHY